MAAKGLLLINLGSPDSPDVDDVKAYLTQFLTDSYVIDLPNVLRQILVRGLIVPRRAKNSAEAYQKIWTENGSPLVHFTQQFAQKVQASLPELEVRWAMRYGSPSLEEVMEGWKLDELLIIPLYPQFAESSTQTAIDEASKYLPPKLKPKILWDFFSHPAFIDSLTSRIQTHVDEFRPDHLLVSYHGLPEHHLTKMYPDHCLREPGCCEKVSQENRFCYRAQCFATTRALTAQLNYPRNQISVSFQSRLGRRPWIKPYTDYVVPALVKQGVRKLSVACPSFVCDCLETLEEIQMRLREQFIEEGGTDLQLIPALNDSDHWVANFGKMVTEFKA